MVILLTKAGGLLGPINSLLGFIMNAIFEFFNLFHIQNIALSIIMFTIIVRCLMLPLTIRQQKFTKLSSRMNPELQKIQAKYKGKKDEASLKKSQAETQAVYQKYGANPTSGCLPLLITLPIMFALYNVIYRIPAYVTRIKDMYLVLAEKIITNQEYQNAVKTIAETSKYRYKDVSNVDNIVSVLSQFGTEQWNNLSSNLTDLSSLITQSAEKINHANSFFGFNIANQPGWSFPAVLIPILAAVLSFVQSKQAQMTSSVDTKNNPTASALNSMIYIMPIMQLFFCVAFPIGIGLYWIVTSLVVIIQQFFINRYLNQIDVDQLIEKSIAKAAKKKKRIDTTGGMSLQELAKKQTKTIESKVVDSPITTNKTEINEKEVSEDTGIEIQKENQKVITNPKSISEIANLLKNKK